MPPDRAAQAALAACLPPGWRVEAVRRRTQDTVEVVLRPDGSGADTAAGIALEWAQPDDLAATRAFRKGRRYTASYRRGPTLWDIDAPATPEAIRELAYAAAEALATLAEGPELRVDVGSGGARGAAGGRLPAATGAPADIDALVAALRAAVDADLGSGALPNPEGWELAEVRAFQRWTRVAEVVLRREDRALTFIVTPSDPARPSYSRTANLDLVYYSDDLPVEAHDQLFARDRVTIERFADWLRLSFDGPGSEAGERKSDEPRPGDEGTRGT